MSTFFLGALRIAPALLCLPGLLPLTAQAVTCQDNLPASNPDAAYIVHGDGTATDTRTGLMWKRCAQGMVWDGSENTCSGTAALHTWTEALASAEADGFAGYSDWRLPNIKELRSLVEECRSAPAINDSIFPATPGEAVDSPSFGTSSPAAGDAAARSVWVVFFSSGEADAKYRQGQIEYVRLVRDGQSMAAPVSITTSATPAAGGSVACTSNPVPLGGASTCTASANLGYQLASLLCNGVAAAGDSCDLQNLTAPATVDAHFARITTATFSNLLQEYDGSAKAPDVVTDPSGVGYSLNYMQGGHPATPADAGVYTVTLTLTDPAYVLSGPGSATLTIARADATITLADLLHTWDGQPKAASVTTDPADLNVQITYSQNGTDVTAPTDAGHYDVQASISDANYTGSATGTLEILRVIHTVTADTAPHEGGVATCDPAEVEDGERATCSAQANPGYVFTGWSGACVGQGATCTLDVVDGEKHSTALFDALMLAEGPYEGEPLALALAPMNGAAVVAAGTDTVASLGAPLPGGVALPHGVVNLEISVDNAGDAASVVLTYPPGALSAGMVYFKYGATVDDGSAHWYPFEGAQIDPVANTVTLELVDGGDGDHDLLANGRIDDPGGPAVRAAAVAPIPTLNNWLLLLVGLLAATLGLHRLRRDSRSR